jgi:hypothetical protein
LVQIRCKFKIYFIKEIGAKTGLSNGNILNEIVTKISTNAPKNQHIQCIICKFLVQIKPKFNALFGWV